MNSSKYPVLRLFFVKNIPKHYLNIYRTPTPTSTRTPTSTPNLTATQQVIRSTATAQAIQALATDSISQWPILFSDTFDSNENNWTTGTDDDEYANITREIKDGKYTWNVTSKKPFIMWGPTNTGYASDFHLSSEIRRVSGTAQSDYGLIFRRYIGNFYYFGIEGKKFFVFLNYDNKWMDMIKSTESSAILPEETNRLTVIAEGSHFVFFINNQFAGEMTDDHIEKGTATIAIQMHYLNSRAAFEFDNFELRVP